MQDQFSLLTQVPLLGQGPAPTPMPSTGPSQTPSQLGPIQSVQPITTRLGPEDFQFFFYPRFPTYPFHQGYPPYYGQTRLVCEREEDTEDDEEVYVCRREPMHRYPVYYFFRPYGFF